VQTGQTQTQIQFGGILESIDVQDVANEEVQEQFLRWVDARKEELDVSSQSLHKSPEGEAIAGLLSGKFRWGVTEAGSDSRGRQVVHEIPRWVQEAQTVDSPLQAVQGIEEQSLWSSRTWIGS
jgi:hypothetical protein